MHATTHIYPCKIVIINTGIEFCHDFFIVPGNGPALLHMPECKR